MSTYSNIRTTLVCWTQFQMYGHVGVINDARWIVTQQSICPAT